MDSDDIHYIETVNEQFEDYINNMYPNWVSMDKTQLAELRQCWFSSTYRLLVLLKYEAADLSKDGGVAILQTIERECQAEQKRRSIELMGTLMNSGEASA
jgi:hypothetical protein